MTTKECRDCGKIKPLNEFYKHPRMKDGYLNSCKVCRKTFQLRHRALKEEYYREFDRKRSKVQKRKKFREDYAKRYKKKYPERIKAMNMVNSAVKNGKLKKSLQCDFCGKTKKRLEAHHYDYSQPLKVSWLCKPCHCKADKCLLPF